MYATQDQSQLPDVPDFIKNEVKKNAFKKQGGDSLGGHSFTRAASSLNHYFIVAKLKNKGQLYAWGVNTNNVLGLGIENGEFNFPMKVNFFSALEVFQVSCGYSHTAVLVKGISEASGRVYTMGLGDRGRLGYTRGHTEFGNEHDKNDLNESWYTPIPCIVNFPFNAKISRISCGANHSLALSDSGLVFAWGIGQYGCLGTGELNDVYSPVKIEAGPTDKKVLHIAAGARHSLCCNEDGQVFAWGSNSNGRLGTGGSYGMKTVPTQIKSLSQYHITLVAAGESHSGCIDSFGYIYTWGNGGSGKLGHGTQSDCNIPRRIEGISSLPFVQLTLGAFNSMALSQSGEVYIWGAKQHEIISLPTKIDAFDSHICHINSGPYISFAMDVRHNIYLWNNRLLVNSKKSEALNANEEQLYKRMNSKNPVLLPFFQSKAFVDDCIFYMGFNLVDYKGNKVSYEPKSEGGLFSVNRIYKSNGSSEIGSLVGSQIPSWSVRQIACGTSHTLLLVYGGTIFAWGDNKYGQLGIDTRRRKSQDGDKNESFLNEPTEIKFSEPIRRVACGSWHSLCCDIKGNCFSWGRGDRGQLGTGAIRNLYEPAGIVTLKNVIEVAGGELYSACIVACITTGNKDLDTINSGDLWIWGDGDLGKLGLGDHVLKSCIAAPRHLNLGTPIIKVALGSSHTLALTASGELITWGAGYYGRLGTNSTKSHSNPIKIRFPIKGVQIVDIAVGSYHSMAVSSLGDLWVWGKAENVLSEKDVLTPYIFAKLESPSGIPRIYSIHAFGDVSYAITQSGVLWIWGPENSETENIQGLETSIKIKSHTGRAEMIVLPGNAIGVSGSTTHHVCLLASGEVVSWGDPSRGKLGQQDIRNKKYIEDPTLVIQKWNDAKNMLDSVGKGDSSAGLATDKKKNYTKDEGVTTIEELEAFMGELTSKSVHFSKKAKSFEYVQSLLHKEDPRTRKDSISLLEEDLVVLFSSHIEYFRKMKEEEERLRYLIFLAEVQMRRLINMIQSANSNSFIFIEDNYYRNIYGDYFNSFILKYMSMIEYIFTILRTQPLYIINLMLECSFGEEFISILNCLYGLFPPQLEYVEVFETKNFHGLNDSLIMLEIIGEILCKRELQEAFSTNDVFWPGKSKFLYYLSSVVLRGPDLRSLVQNLLDIYTPTSLVSVIAKFPKEVLLVLDSSCLAQYLGISPNDESLPKHYLNMVKFAEVALLVGISENINKNIKFPRILERLLYKACKLVNLMEIPSFNPLLDYKQQKDQAIQQPLIRLLLYGIILPILEQCNAYCTYFYFPLITDMRIMSSIQLLAHSIKIFLAGYLNQTSSSQGFLWINSLISFSSSITIKISEMVNEQKDLTDLSLTYLSYNSQYSLHSDNYHVVLNLVDIMVMINSIQKYKNFLRLNLMDPVINSVEYFSRRDKLSIPFFPLEFINLVKNVNLLPNSDGGGVFVSIRISPRWIINNDVRQSRISNYLRVSNISSNIEIENSNRRANRKFYDLDEQNYDEIRDEENTCLPPLDTSMMFCPLTKIGMSQSLLPRFEANVRKSNGISEFGLFIRYFEIPDKRRAIEKGLLILPIITARTMFELLETVDEYIEQFKRKENDKRQYEQLSFMLEFRKVVEELMLNYQDSITPLLIWITNEIMNRIKHRAYLEHLLEIEEKLRDKRKWYKDQLNEWEDAIEKSVINMTLWGYKDTELINLLNIYYKNNINTTMKQMENVLYNTMISGYYAGEDDLTMIKNGNYITTDIIKKSITLPFLCFPLSIFIMNNVIKIKSDEKIFNLFESQRKTMMNFFRRTAQMNNWTIFITFTPTLGLDCIITTSRSGYKIQSSFEQRIICKFYITPDQVKKAKFSNFLYTRLYSNGLVEVNLPSFVSYVYSQI
ncbi:unnamed protein product [Cryptosporidium hominis]|uniref:RCC1 domain containing protein n=1 Tax=Cryptosporidium hominis TaxID=237895 RepID=A0A0S4TD92_CRYHO|nr:hect domain and RLD 2 [Cryptosporidium hominis TU502]OLQ16602.1 Regulator of chromosome condensation repeat protein [Cryptosporidium hominis]PPA65241.1 Regulator of chromosome condensation (RCC1) repeat family protein [Cryptosporidium hominis]PPS92966.1 RCC1 domain containing protein [Cryptosporidium hominis]CUV04847.1 unnamed protein product [Cryptosporidium hominis]|eukprot:PPS92966.1 RCC1 domain containing protein [Cryptosporidium hominis]